MIFGVHLPMEVMMEKQIDDTLDSTSIVNEELRKEADLHPAASVASRYHQQQGIYS